MGLKDRFADYARVLRGEREDGQLARDWVIASGGKEHVNFIIKFDK